MKYDDAPTGSLYLIWVASALIERVVVAWTSDEKFVKTRYVSGLPSSVVMDDVPTGEIWMRASRLAPAYVKKPEHVYYYPFASEQSACEAQSERREDE